MYNVDHKASIPVHFVYEYFNNKATRPGLGPKLIMGTRNKQNWERDWAWSCSRSPDVLC